jgi:hypothetical protein
MPGKTTLLLLLVVMFSPAPGILALDALGGAPQDGCLRAGMIGLDTSHVVAFATLLNNPKPRPALAGARVVAAYPGGSPDLPFSRNSVKGYTDALRGMGIEIVDSIDQLLKRVDVVLLESADGRQHLAQAKPVIAAGKPLFIDKPMAASVADAMRIFQLCEQKNVPCFSASSLRFAPDVRAVRQGTSGFGGVKGCTAWSCANLDMHQDEPFWYHGIHGVELLFAILGPGCKTVSRIAPDRMVGTWNDGRKGTYVAKSGYGVAVEGTHKSGTVGENPDYEPAVAQIVAFFKSGKPPVAAEETIEVLAFMEAADASGRRSGQPVLIEDVLKKARSVLTTEQ